MRAIYRHELASYFKNLSGYVFGAFLMLFAGIYTMGYNLYNRYLHFEYVIGDLSFVFLFIVPILTMRVLAEERKQRTDQLLYSLPITMTKVVLGKFAVLMTVFLIPVAIINIYPIFLSRYGNIHLMTSFSASIAFVLLGGSLIAIGMFISSMTESQAISAGLCFVVMLVNYYIANLSAFVSDSAFASCVAFAVLILLAALIVRLMTRSTFTALVVAILLEGCLGLVYILKAEVFAGLFPEIMTQLSLFERFYSIVNGVFDLTGAVYFITVIGVFLYLCVQSLEKRRWSE